MVTELNDVGEIERQIAELQERKKLLLEENRPKVLEEIRATIRLYGFTPAELGFTLSRSVKNWPGSRKINGMEGEEKPAKYANPDNPAETWHGGKGPKPKWAKEILEKEGTLDRCLIQKSA